MSQKKDLVSTQGIAPQASAETHALIKQSSVNLQASDIDLEVSVLHRHASLKLNARDMVAKDCAPILFLHGFGSTKEDYADIVLHSAFNNNPFIAYDAPGCGNTKCGDNSVDHLQKINIPFLVKTALAILDHYKVEQFHLVGHSMGGLTALMLASQIPERVLSFVDIEGNVAPEDCFLSRQIISHNIADPDEFFAEFIERARLAPAFASALYAASLQHKVRAGAVRSIFESMVALSDSGKLLETFIQLPMPKTFMYGAQNAGLSYLPQLKENGVHLAEISFSGHFPMYSNPTAMWAAIAALHFQSAPRTS